MQILGGNGYINEYPTGMRCKQSFVGQHASSAAFCGRCQLSTWDTGRLLRDAKLYEIGAGTSEIRRMLIGRELFKEHA